MTMSVLPSNQSFEKWWENEEHTEFGIWYIVPKKTPKKVDKNKQLYLDWVDEGHTPIEREYVPPTPVPPRENWSAFRHWLKSSDVFTTLVGSNTPPIICSALIDALRQNDLEDVRTFTALANNYAGFSEKEKTDVNTAAANENIGWIFEVE